MTTQFYCLTWKVQDTQKKCVIHAFGKTPDNEEVHLSMDYHPYFYVEGNHLGHTAVKLRDRLRSEGQREDALLASDCKTQQKYSFLGFATKPKTVTELRFLTQKAYRTVRTWLESQHEVLYESNVDTELQLLHELALPAVGWLSVNNRFFISKGYAHVPFYALTGSVPAVRKADASLGLPLSAPCVLASYDIESYSSTGKFPDPNNPGDCVFMVATTFQMLGEPQPFAQHLALLDECASDKLHDDESANYPLTVDVARTEEELIDTWAAHVLSRGTDVLVAYNNYGFDDRYLDTRHKMSSGSKRGVPLSRMFRGGVREGAWLRRLRSDTPGFADPMVLMTAGIFNMDLLQVLKKQQQLDSYSLNSVSEHFLGDKKIDLPAKEMFKLYEQGRGGKDPEAIADIGRYCLKDTELPLRLMDKLNIVPNLLEMSSATIVPVDFLVQRGQSIRCLSQVVNAMHAHNMILPARMMSSAESYEGATVFPPEIGAHWAPVTVLDFAR